MRLQGKTAIIWGATQGAALDTTRRYADNGARVMITGRRAEVGEQLARTFRDNGQDVAFQRCDVSVESDVRDAVEATVERWGKLDVSIYNAYASSVQSDGRLHAIADEDNDTFAEWIGPGINGLFWASKYAIHAMLAGDGGAIINISSTVSVRGVSGLGTYSMTKGAMNALTRSIAIDYGKHNIRCNAVVVGGVVANDMTEVLAASFASTRALPRAGTGDDVAWMCVYLGSDEASYITGGEFACDGGGILRTALPNLPQVFDDATRPDPTGR